MRHGLVVDTTRLVAMASADEDTDKWMRLFLGEPDILRRILRSLPKWKDVLNCRLVCRQWMEEIEKDQDFWERVSNALTFLYQTVHNLGFTNLSAYYNYSPITPIYLLLLPKDVGLWED